MPRNGSGVYSLPTATNPVVAGTVISTTWANPTMADIATQLNNVVTRDGLLGMTVPALFVDGNLPLPGISFVTQPSTGFYLTPTALSFSYTGVLAGFLNASGFNGVFGATTPAAGTFTTLTADTPASQLNTTRVPTTAYLTTYYASFVSPAFTGVPTAPTAAFATNTTQIASTAFVQTAAFNSNLPLQTGNAGKLITTDGSSASWAALKTINRGSLLGAGDVALVTLAGIESLSNKTLVEPALGTPISGVATNLTGTAAALNIGGTATTATGANALYSATTTVNVSAATAPTSGQILTATGASTATWQTASGSTPDFILHSFNIT